MVLLEKKAFLFRSMYPPNLEMTVSFKLYSTLPWGWSVSRAGKVLALHVADLGSIPGTPCGRGEHSGGWGLETK